MILSDTIAGSSPEPDPPPPPPPEPPEPPELLELLEPPELPELPELPEDPSLLLPGPAVDAVGVASGEVLVPAATPPVGAPTAWASLDAGAADAGTTALELLLISAEELTTAGPDAETAAAGVLMTPLLGRAEPDMMFRHAVDDRHTTPTTAIVTTRFIDLSSPQFRRKNRSLSFALLRNGDANG